MSELVRIVGCSVDSVESNVGGVRKRPRLAQHPAPRYHCSQITRGDTFLLHDAAGRHPQPHFQRTTLTEIVSRPDRNMAWDNQ